MNRNKGFTLIELMVVLSIISLLSAIVLVSVKDVRDRAKMSKFRSEISQFVTALELYKNDNGKYPYGDYGLTTGTRYYYGKKIDNSEYGPSSTTTAPLLSDIAVLGKYIPKLPESPNKASSTNSAYFYGTNSGTVSLLNLQFKYEDDLYTPEYYILIPKTSENKLAVDSFPNPKGYFMTSPPSMAYPVNPSSLYVCLSSE